MNIQVVLSIAIGPLIPRLLAVTHEVDTATAGFLEELTAALLNASVLLESQHVFKDLSKLLKGNHNHGFSFNLEIIILTTGIHCRL